MKIFKEALGWIAAIAGVVALFAAVGFTLGFLMFIAEAGYKCWR